MKAGFRVGIVLRQEDVEANGRRLGALAERIVAAGIDHATVGDHVSFADGQGADGLIQATALLAAHSTLAVETGVYILTLRHPALVARQLATLGSIAPGRFTFGVGIGGDDPAELRLCGVDPTRRGARAEESLTVLRAFLGGGEVDFDGKFFRVEGGTIRPAPDPTPRIVVGGRADAAIARAGRHGDAWIGVWVSATRFTTATELFAEAAAAAGRAPRGAEHVLQIWAGFGADPAAGRAAVAPVMERAYSIAADRFKRYVPCGRPEQIAAALAPYVDAGVRRFNIVPEGGALEARIEAVGAVRQQLENEHRGVLPHHARD